MLSRFDPEDRVYLTDPRAYNIRWLELLHAVKPTIESFASVLMRALITGGGGQLAFDLATLLGPDARVFDRTTLDITDSDRLDRVFAEADPDVVFNCAAFHNVDVCETEPERSWQVNVEAVRQLAARSRMLVHVSTNYVFDGERVEPYAEHDVPSPRSIYALTKLAGEYAAVGYCERALVVRTAGLYGLHGSVEQGRKLRPADDRPCPRGRIAANGRGPVSSADVHRGSRHRNCRRSRCRRHRGRPPNRIGGVFLA